MEKISWRAKVSKSEVLKSWGSPTYCQYDQTMKTHMVGSCSPTWCVTVTLTRRKNDLHAKQRKKKLTDNEE